MGQLSDQRGTWYGELGIWDLSYTTLLVDTRWSETHRVAVRQPASARKCRQHLKMYETRSTRVSPTFPILIPYCKIKSSAAGSRSPRPRALPAHPQPETMVVASSAPIDHRKDMHATLTLYLPNSVARTLNISSCTRFFPMQLRDPCPNVIIEVFIPAFRFVKDSSSSPSRCIHRNGLKVSASWP